MRERFIFTVLSLCPIKDSAGYEGRELHNQADTVRPLPLCQTLNFVFVIVERLRFSWNNGTFLNTATWPVGGHASGGPIVSIMDPDLKTFKPYFSINCTSSLCP